MECPNCGKKDCGITEKAGFKDEETGHMYVVNALAVGCACGLNLEPFHGEILKHLNRCVIVFIEDPDVPGESKALYFEPMKTIRTIKDFPGYKGNPAISKE